MINNKNNNHTANKNKNNSTGVLDASALMALFNDEKGCDVVYRILGGACISAVTLCEVLSEISKQGGALSVFIAQIEALELEVIPFDFEIAKIAAELLNVADDSSITLEERASLALAIHLSLPLYTRQHAFAGLELPVKVRMI